MFRKKIDRTKDLNQKKLEVPIYTIQDLRNDENAIIDQIIAYLNEKRGNREVEMVPAWNELIRIDDVIEYLNKLKQKIS